MSDSDTDELDISDKPLVLATYTKWAARNSKFPVTLLEAISFIGCKRETVMTRFKASVFKGHFHVKSEIVNGHHVKRVTMTTHAFKCLCLMARTDRGAQVRDWFIAAVELPNALEERPTKIAKVAGHAFDPSEHAARVEAYDDFHTRLAELGPLDAEDKKVLKAEIFTMLKPSTMSSTVGETPPSAIEVTPKASDVEEAPPPPPPEDEAKSPWQEGFCDVHKRPFYWHKETREARWDLPA